jgi:phosphoenolpyruvate synthase/pyruvate phosphate dikinase
LGGYKKFVLKTVLSSDKLVLKLKKQKWWVEEAPGVPFLFDYIMKTFVSHQNIIGYPSLREHILIKNKNISLEISPYNEKISNFKFLIKNETKNFGYFLNLIKPWEKLRNDLLKLNKEVLSKVAHYNNEKLFLFVKQFTKISFESVVYGSFIECVDPFTEYYKNIFQKKYKLSSEQALLYIGILSTPKRRSFLTQEKIDFYKLCLKKVTYKYYLNKYFWIHTNYSQSKDIIQSDLKKAIKQELSLGILYIRKQINETIRKERDLHKKKINLSKKIKLDQKDKTIFKLISLCAEYIDIRKESMMRNTYARDKLLLIISKNKKINIKKLRNLRDEELLDLIQNKKLNWQPINKRTNGYVVYFTPKSSIDFYDKSVKVIYEGYLKSIFQKILSGTVASAPIDKIRGKICIVVDVHKEKFKPGTILVTTMTRPEFMSHMRKAQAIITDEGGITCHAAIISRELHIPCIIGTKIATKFLKNGDFVEMNLKNGIIQKL